MLLLFSKEEVISAVSPDLTRVPPANQIVDNQNAVWTIVGNQIHRNGQWNGGGLGSILTWCGGFIRVFGTDNRWWVWDGGTTWTPIGTVDPCVPLQPQFIYQLTADQESVNFTIMAVPSWLTATLLSGVTPQAVTFKLSPQASSLSPGVYTATIYFIARNGQGTTTRKATLGVNAAPRLAPQVGLVPPKKRPALIVTPSTNMTFTIQK